MSLSYMVQNGIFQTSQITLVQLCCEKVLLCIIFTIENITGNYERENHNTLVR